MTLEQGFNPVVWSGIIVAFLFVIMVTLLGILSTLNDISNSLKDIKPRNDNDQE